jgi:hypothetical protein
VTVVTVRCGASHRSVSGLQDGLACPTKQVRASTFGGDQSHIFNGAAGVTLADGALGVWIAVDVFGQMLKGGVVRSSSSPRIMVGFFILTCSQMCRATSSLSPVPFARLTYGEDRAKRMGNDFVGGGSFEMRRGADVA